MSTIRTIKQLVEENHYPKNLLLQLAHCESFSEFGFSTGEKRKTYYFYLEKLERYLERREEYERS